MLQVQKRFDVFIMKTFPKQLDHKRSGGGVIVTHYTCKHTCISCDNSHHKVHDHSKVAVILNVNVDQCRHEDDG